MRSIRNCDVCVVGGAGFLGSHLVNHLIEDRGCRVLVIDNLITGRREFIHPDVVFEHADITGSESHLLRLFRTHQIEYVFNYAAWPYIPDSFERPLQVFAVNAAGALHVINAAQEAGCQGILQVSSAEIYGDGYAPRSLASDPAAFGPYDGVGGSISEDAPVVPHSSYGAAKAAIDAMVQVRWREAKTPVIALRQFNCVGERDLLHPYIVPEVIIQLRNGPKVSLGNNSSRDFMYAGDAVQMAVELLERGQWGEVYNLGSEESVKIYDLARLIGKAMGFQSIEIVQDPARIRPWEIWHLQSDNSKIYSTIESRPQVSLEEALERTIKSVVESNWGFSW